MKSLFCSLFKLFCCSLLALPAHAGYLAVAESGEILPQGDYLITLLPQLRVSEGGGINVDGALDSALSDSTSFRLQAGAGQVDFHLGGSVKYIPFPDIDNQPAMGVKAGAWYARDAGENFISLLVAPLVSRRMDSEYGLFVPYAALPVSMVNYKSKNTVGTQIAFGSELRNTNWKNVILTGELAINLSDSFSAVTFGLSFPLDQAQGLKRQ